SASVTVNPAAASTFTVTASPATVTAGSSTSVTVTAKDPYGNTATGYAGTVHFTSGDAQAVLPANSTLSNGTGTFSATPKTARQSAPPPHTATRPLPGAATAPAPPAAASTFAVTAPAPAISGSSFTFTVTAKDPYGNTATGYAGTAAFTSSDAQATLPANSTL